MALAFITLGERELVRKCVAADTTCDALSWDKPLAAAAAGGIFNVANVLLVAGIQRAGLAVAFPVGIGLALVVGTVLTYIVSPAGDDAFLLFSGVGLAFLAILSMVAASASHQQSRVNADARSIPLAAEDGHERPANFGSGRWINFGFCAAAGIMMATWAPLSAFSMRALTPYSSSALFGSAVLTSSAVLLVPLLMCHPPAGATTTSEEYLKLPLLEHALGWLGGAVWAVGTAANLISGAKLGPALSYAVGQAAPMVATAWGVLYYREFAGATYRTVLLICSTFALFIGAIALIALSRK